jgi:hypothetical protein
MSRHGRLAETDPQAMHEVSSSLVAWCDTRKLAQRWQGLERAVYVRGERSGCPEHPRHLLADDAYREIAGEGHFPMLGEPAALAALPAESMNTDAHGGERVRHA